MKESSKRIISGFVFGGVFIASLYTHLSFTILTFIFGFISTKEFNKLTNQSGGNASITDVDPLTTSIKLEQSLLDYGRDISHQKNIVG